MKQKKGGTNLSCVCGLSEKDILWHILIRAKVKMSRCIEDYIWFIYCANQTKCSLYLVVYIENPIYTYEIW